MNFPENFLWGAATSSYQIEGAALEHGRGECIWTRFANTPGKVHNGDSGAVACDHYHRYPEDVALMKSLNLQAYRFSTSWPRVLPAGTGATNPAGLDFYDRLVDELIEANIIPFVTLYHWDLPQALQDRGGWGNPDSVAWFAEYTDLLTNRLGDRVKHWITLNEPWVIAFLGNWMGLHAPGIRDIKTSYRVAHHLMLAHGESMRVIRKNVPESIAGITLDFNPAFPATDSPEDKQAAIYADGQKNRWFTDAVLKGTYPEDMVNVLGDILEGLDLGAVQSAKEPMDFLGVNYYTRTVVAYNEHAPYKVQAISRADFPRTDIGWEIVPDVFRDFLIRLNNDYSPPPLYITENGSAYYDPEPVNGVVQDPKRTEYLKNHLQAISDAINSGVPVHGYFVWSLLDNFEWAYGYDMRFGVVHVDFDTLKRTPKQSALFYRDLIQKRVSTPGG